MNSNNDNKSNNISINILPGVIQGITRVTISYPFDVFKVNMQKMLHANLKETILTILKNDPMKLYRGAMLSYFTVSLERGSQFYMLEKLNRNNNNSYLNSFLISLIVSTYSIPSQYIITNIALHKKNTIQYIKYFIKNENILKLYKGWKIELPRNIINSTIFNGTYYHLRKNYGESNDNALVYGSLSGILCWLVTFPIDTIRTEYQTQNCSIKNIVKNRYNNYGISSFYKGLSPVLIRTIPSASIGMYMYEYSRNLINNVF